MIRNPQLSFLTPEMADRQWLVDMLSGYDETSSSRRNESVNLLFLLIGEEKSSPERLFPASLAICMWLLRSIDDNALFSRFTILTRDIFQNLLVKYDDETLEEASSALGVSTVLLPEKKFQVSALDFIRYNARLSGQKYRLVNQELYSGQVFLDKGMLSKILRECFVSKLREFYDSLSITEARESLGDISGMVDYLARQWVSIKGKQTVDLGKVEQELFPPCIKEYLTEMRDGVNLAHMARFTLTSFLHKIGMTNREIMGLFSTAPDFNERITEYQVDHVTGQISGTEYSPPKCEVLRSNHICFWGEDRLCHQDWLRHPLQYYSVKKKK